MNAEQVESQQSLEPRALRARYIDMLTDGVSPDRLKEGGDKAVDHALMATALSAVCSGMGEQDWLALVLDPKRRLGQQAKFAKGHSRTALAYRRYLSKVWQRATEQARPAALHDRDRYREEARRLVARWDDALPRLLEEAHEIDAMIIAALLDRMVEVGSPRVAFARRPFQEATGVSERRFRTRLAALERAGVVRLEARGKSGGPRARQRLANVYSLSGPERLFDRAGSD
ncbi:hypothetical protein [Nocardioides zhouii]|jgi:DNA-binding transcriptional ArsR family regulator|uniref:Uncharacterized protein n=1 Tax=Nocardioides zhouii TaxID=1168729 RepID=A0A4V1RNF1_9ACTN|nr:hypothetical protein [Nocardioides zhouii]RYC05637.1 hypothetical protein EUA94_17980 [Nocardioides zhouii]